MKKILLPITMFALATHMQAQTQAHSKDSLAKVQTLKAIEISAIRAGDDAPFAKKDISGKALEKENLGQDLPYLLQYTPSAIVTSDGGTGIGYTGIRIRGTDATRINVTMNGIPVNDPEEQATFFVDIPDIASSTGSIQIQRGVGTSTNGAGSFGATVSISNLQQFDSAGAILNSSIGSFNTYKNTLLAGTGMLKNGWQFDVRLSKINSDGYIQRSSTDLKSLQFTAGWKASENTWFHFMVMTGTEKTGQAWDGVPSDSLKTNRTYNELGLQNNGTFYPNQSDNYQQTYYQAFLDHKFSPYITAHVGLFLTQGKGYYEEYHGSELLSNYGLSNAPQDTIPTALTRQLWLDNAYYGGVFSFLYEKKKTQLTIGGGITQFENLHYGVITWAENGGVPPNYKWYQDDAQKNDYNIYAKLQQHVNSKLIVFADLQLRDVAYYINGFQDNPNLKPAVNYTFFNPKAGLTYLLKDTYQQKQKIYASIAVGNKEPNHDDYEIDSLHLPKPETLYDVEAGYEFNSRKLSFGANFYYMYYHDQLVLTGELNDVGGAVQTNVPKSYRTGIELMGAYAPFNWVRILGNATFSENKIANFTSTLYDSAYNAYQHTYSNTNISFSPSIVATGTLVFTPFHHMSHGQHLDINISEKYVGKQYLDNTSSNDRALSDYAYCNVLVRYSLVARPFREIAFTLAVNNVFNKLYSSNGAVYPYVPYGGEGFTANGNNVNNINYYYPQAGTNVLGGVTLKF
ncbi:MAG: TonB-dependent receptor [Flavipsychrobacter sp.]|nr:TonB-dependent receptor [Flavipsychrobacter sp.]